MGKSRLLYMFWFCDTALSVTGFQSWFGEEQLILSNLDSQPKQHVFLCTCLRRKSTPQLLQLVRLAAKTCHMLQQQSL